MNKGMNIYKLIEMLKFNYWMGGTVAAEAEQMIIYLLGEHEAAACISMWSEELEQDVLEEYQEQQNK